MIICAKLSAHVPRERLAYPNMGVAGQHEHFGVLIMSIEFIARGVDARYRRLPLASGVPSMLAIIMLEIAYRLSSLSG